MGERKGWRVGSVRVEERVGEEVVIMLVCCIGIDGTLLSDTLG